MTWWKNKPLLVREKQRLEDEFKNNNFRFLLRDNSLWLVGQVLKFFDFELKYPSSYPFAPPDIFPKDKSTKWVPKHQYIKNGRFCLDIREKGWNSTLSASDIIKSLEKLLIAEKERKEKQEKEISLYEEDEPTKLQKRFKIYRGIFPIDLLKTLKSNYGNFKFIYHSIKNESRIIITQIVDDEKSIKSQIVKNLWGSFPPLEFDHGCWIKVPFAIAVDLLYSKDLVEFENILIENKIFSSKKIIHETIYTKSKVYVLLNLKDYPYIYYLAFLNIEKREIKPYGTYLYNPNDIFDRLPSNKEFEFLKYKKATIIGCGSGGSFIAEQLVKSGIGKIVLVDDDSLVTENVIRHICRLDDISFSKVHAVENVLLKINPKLEIECIKTHVDVVDTKLMEKISDSNLIIIATACDEEIINEYAYKNNIPAIYAKVYPYGFGGEIIRIVPQSTPCFECCNYLKDTLIDEHFNETTFPQYNTITYDQTLDDNIPIPSLSIDANFVALITAKLSLDILISTDREKFKNENTVFLWGNQKEWIFNNPFELFKINNKDLKNLKNCMVCFDKNIIRHELKMTKREIFHEYKNIISTFEKE